MVERGKGEREYYPRVKERGKTAESEKYGPKWLKDKRGRSDN